MADRELVIKLSEEEYESIKKHPHWHSLGELIANGIPLPKGHGRLIDADALEKEICPFEIYHSCGDCKYTDYCTQDAPTIIEADKE